ncbi:hypothetical protein QL285_081736 [Trifolium repens]|nr:hypothetical protein QL285_081736 [Trifolium repens]
MRVAQLGCTVFLVLSPSHSEDDAATHDVDLPEGSPGAVPEVQAASSPVAPDLEEDGSADSEGQELSEHEFADEEEEDMVLLREPTVPKRKKKDVKGPLWSDCRFGDVVPVEFPGGRKEQDVLSLYGSHIAKYVYEGFDHVQLTPISHKTKLRVFNKKLPNEAWFTERIAKTGLAELATTGHMLVDSFLVSAFAERWHEETSSFHLPAGEEGTKLMVDLIEADPDDVEKEMVMTKGSHVRHTYLRMHFQTFWAHIADYEVEGNQDEVLRHQNFALKPICCSCCARMPLQGPLRLHRTLRQHTRMLHDSVQAWIHHHFPTLCECLEDQSYDETMPSANRYSPRGGDKSVRARRVSLDLLLGCDIHWAPYATHRPTRSLDEVCFYSGWLKCGGKVAMYLPERVLRQFGHMQSIPCHPRESAPPFLSHQATALIPASLHFASYRDWVLTAAQRGPLAIDPWYAAAGYMRWYFWISHPYMTPLLRGDTPRPFWRSRLDP